MLENKIGDNDLYLMLFNETFQTQIIWFVYDKIVDGDTR